MKVVDKIDIIHCYESEWTGLYTDGKLLYQSNSTYLSIGTAVTIFNNLGCEVRTAKVPSEIYYVRQAKFNDPYPKYLKDIESALIRK